MRLICEPLHDKAGARSILTGKTYSYENAAPNRCAKREERPVREGSNPNFCPPVEEGLTINFEDSKGDATVLEFLGLLLHGGHRYGVFFPVSEEEPALSSGEVIILEAVEFDEDDQPSAFELVEDEGVAMEVYAAFQEATKGLYGFE